MCDLENGDFLILNYTGGGGLDFSKKKKMSACFISVRRC